MSQTAKSREIDCTNCKATTLVRSEAIYEGLRTVDHVWICTACGARYPSTAATPFHQEASAPAALFTADDRVVPPKVFAADERRHSCAWCQHLVLNPFEQRCGRTNREVEATDLCDAFTLRQEEPAAAEAPPPKKDPLAAIFGS